MLIDPSGRITLMSPRVPGERAGVVAFMRVGPLAETPEAAAPPIETVSPAAKSKPAIVISAPPPADPDAGASVVPGGTMRPIWPVKYSVNHRLPSGPSAIPSGPAASVGIENSMAAPAVVRRTILLSVTPVNQRLPSGPDVTALPE